MKHLKLLHRNPSERLEILNLVLRGKVFLQNATSSEPKASLHSIISRRERKAQRKSNKECTSGTSTGETWHVTGQTKP